MQQVISLIVASGNIDSVKDRLLCKRAPWIEYSTFKTHSTDYQLLTTHLNYHMTPNGVKNKMTKIIYVARNPKDVIVSFYHFHKYCNFLMTPKDFQHFLEQFAEGNVLYGSWFDHIRDWYSHKDELDILFVTYENMQKDLRSVIKKVAIFLNKKLDGETLESILDQCTFNHMKANPKTNFELSARLFDAEKSSFYRKGIVGDWKNHFLVTQSEWFDAIYQGRMADFPLKNTSNIVFIDTPPFK
uniref:amine sulfotransferase-like n=1 Tax=Pristiophorus japonicus TaxID=55135 RepID=UPI00398E6F37